MMAEHQKNAAAAAAVVLRNPYVKKKEKKTYPGVGIVNNRQQPQQHGLSSSQPRPLPPSKTKGETSASLSKETDDDCTAATSSASASSASALVISASDKAGMQGIDRARIDAIILRESGNSLFMQQQRKRDEQVNERIARLRKKLEDKKHKENNNNHWKEKIQHSMDREIQEILAARPTRSTCVVVDQDMFYMACELLSRPELHDQPACVGHGMILTSNYTARRYGVRSAMAGWIADKLVQELSNGTQRLIHVPSNFELYQQKSKEVRQALEEYDPHLTTMSLDESYMDLGPYLVLKITHPDWSHAQISSALTTNTTTNESTCKTEETKIETGIDHVEEEDEEAECQHHSDAQNDDAMPVDEITKATTTTSEATSATSRRRRRRRSNSQGDNYDNNALDFLATIPAHHCMTVAAGVLHDMRQRVQQATGGLTCSAGLAPNFLLAKIASDANKPNGQCLVPADCHADIEEFLHPLPIRKVSGIGRVTEKTLHAFHIQTVGDLYRQRALVRFLFDKEKTANFLLRASLGCGSSAGGPEDSSSNSEKEPSSSLQKSVSRERTFSSSKSWTELNVILEDLARAVSHDMVNKNLWARTITVKVKLDTFDVLSKSHSLSQKGRVCTLQKATDLVSLATLLLRDIRRDFEEWSSSMSASQPSNNSKKSLQRSRLFSPRLVGVRCSNFGERTDEQGNVADGVALGGASRGAGQQQQYQGTMDKFVVSAQQRQRVSTTMSPHYHHHQEPEPQQQQKQQSSTGSSPILGAAAKHDQSTDQPAINLDTRTTSPSPQQGPCPRRRHNSRSPFVPVQPTRAVPVGTITPAAFAVATTAKSTSFMASSTTSTITTKVNTTMMIQCPICQQQSFAPEDNAGLNRHVDSCLSGKVVREVVQQQEESSRKGNTSNKRRRTLTDFW